MCSKLENNKPLVQVRESELKASNKTGSESIKTKTSFAQYMNQITSRYWHIKFHLQVQKEAVVRGLVILDFGRFAPRYA